MRHKLLVAGVGQLGSRYLQGLSQLIESLEIHIFDPSPVSLVRAKQRWNEMQPQAAHELHFVTSLSSLPKNIDLAIVATTADVRAWLVAEIARYADISCWVLEKVLAQSVGEIADLQRTLQGRSAWVNTPMYLWPLYRKLRQLYKVGVPVEAYFEGFRGLACNSIHYIDFVSRWNGAMATQVDVSGLEPEWYAAKRDGFYEIDGDILVSFSDGSKLKLGSYRDKLSYQVKLRIGQDEWSVLESEGKALATDGRVVEGGIEFQSQLTAPMVQAIFTGQPCGLPTLAESGQQHTLFLNALLTHWNEHMLNKLDRLPIT